MGRQRHSKRSLGSLYDQIFESRILLVGAGGIGCELLKNLVLTGFGEIHVVDLDTIDLSNLNRQFLFRHEHIKKSKALVAKEAAAKFNPNVKIEAHHANIKDPRFNIHWFQHFQIVFNALDNIDARRYVNKMCLAAGIPLIESGTTGFNGQVQVIKRGQTECYDCNVKEVPKTFPVCTIRTTPSQPIHSIVWAKSYLFAELFGTSEDDAPHLDHTEDQENAQEIENLRREALALRRIREARGSDEFPRKVFKKVFHDDIERLRGMEDVWRSRKPPQVLDYDTISNDASSVDASVAMQDQRTWSTAENLTVFNDSVRRLARRVEKAQASTASGDAPAILTFDKDDADALDFVTASANLRSIVFDIEAKSKFEVKQTAGNIIPAIATTNAMVAALCVLQAFHVMRNQIDSARMVFLTKSADRVISTERLSRPRHDCPTCSVAQSRLEVDTSRATLKDLVEDFLRMELGYGDEFSVNNEIGTLYDPDLDDNLPKRFMDLGIKDDSFLTVIDEAEDDPRVNLVLAIAEKYLPPGSKPIQVVDRVEVGRRLNADDQPTGSMNGHANGVSNSVSASIGKRKRGVDEADLDSEQQQITKRGRVCEGSSSLVSKVTDGGTPIVLDGGADDSASGAITIADE